MAKLLVLIAFCQLALTNYVRSEDANPLLELASSFLQNMGENGGNPNNLAAIGNLVGSLMQGDNAKNLGAILGQGEKNGNGPDLLSGLGGLLAGSGGQIDPAVFGSMVDWFMSQPGLPEHPAKKKKREAEEKKNNMKNNNNNNIDLLSMASGLLGNKDVAALLPTILNVVSSFSDTEAQKRSSDHKDHASFLPPFLEKLHVYWDLFINSELGKTIWEKSGIKKMMKAFTGPDGNLSFDMMFKSFENHSFRRHWIKSAALYLTDIVVHVAKPEVYQRYMITGEYFLNGFLDSQGFPKTAHFNSQKPDKSITALLNYVLKQYLNMDLDVSEYVKPATDYIKQTIKMAGTVSSKLSTRADYHALADRITDTLNLEVIEPVLRVYRAYKHSVQAPHCQEHLMCLVNRHHDLEKQGLPGFKVGLTKFSSMVASAALSFQNGKGFWDLYNAIQNDVNCDAAYPAECESFHEHELKVTTEVYHQEL